MNIYQLDAFTNKVFHGNPAAVCPLNEWLPDNIMQGIAMENNLSETAFFITNGDDYDLRWFTPKAEIKLCGHATLASAYVIFEILKHKKDKLHFHTLSGLLIAMREDDKIKLDFPADIFNETTVTAEMKNAIGVKPEKAFYGRDVLMLVLQSEHELVNMKTDFRLIESLHPHGLIVTSRGSESDFSSRCFFPHYGINEDPVTGSAHTILIPYWSHVLNKATLTARQLSARTGTLWCRISGNRVHISGHAVMYLRGEYFI